MSAMIPLDSLQRRVFPRIREVGSCWEWSGAKSKGYGIVGYRQKNVYLHRLMYELRFGPIPRGLTIDHLCRNRACCNPEHMEVVTAGENTLRGETLTRANKAKTHCPRGHAYDSANTYRMRHSRYCKKCLSIRRRRRCQMTGK